MTTTDISASKLKQYIPIAVFCIVIATCILIPLKIISYGFMPVDDALRHVAKAISGKSWQEIIITRPGIIMDHNPGWHAILRLMHTTVGLDKDHLMVFSIVSLFFLFIISALPWTKRPETWLAAILIISIISPDSIFRIAFGRPLILSMCALVMILAMWTQHKPASYITRMLLTVFLFILTTWIHGSWYLFLIPITAFFIARQTREAISLAACWIIGTITGAALTGDPVRFLVEQVCHAQWALGKHIPAKLLVSEFHPSSGEYQVLMVIALILIWQTMRNRKISLLNNPVFILICLSWILGLKVTRSWIDWGLPALALWISHSLSSELSESQPYNSIQRLITTILICTVLFISTTNDVKGRWTDNLAIPYLTVDESELEPSMPEPGGIIYSPHMQVFYRTFYRFPKADWRYLVAFEPALMPQEDFYTYIQIWWHGLSSETSGPWIEKMQPTDRFIIFTREHPNIPDLSWQCPLPGTWIGKTLPE